MNHNLVDYQSIMLFIINNPKIRSFEELEARIGYAPQTIRKAMKMLNIQISKRPKHCVG